MRRAPKPCFKLMIGEMVNGTSEVPILVHENREITSTDQKPHKHLVWEHISDSPPVPTFEALKQTIWKLKLIRLSKKVLNTIPY